jgi:hypothetical protein
MNMYLIPHATPINTSKIVHTYNESFILKLPIYFWKQWGKNWLQPEVRICATE